MTIRKYFKYKYYKDTKEITIEKIDDYIPEYECNDIKETINGDGFYMNTTKETDENIEKFCQGISQIMCQNLDALASLQKRALKEFYLFNDVWKKYVPNTTSETNENSSD